MNREPMTTHQYENNGMGASICRVCGHLQTIPDWPFECSKVEKEPSELEIKLLSALARAIGLLEGMGYPDKIVTEAYEQALSREGEENDL